MYKQRQAYESSVTESDDNKDDPSFYIQKKKKKTEKEYVELPLKRVKITHTHCTSCDSTKTLIVVPLESRIHAFRQRGIFIPKDNRCCQTHLIKKRFFYDELRLLREYSNHSFVDTREILQFLASKVDVSLHSQIGDYSLSEEKLKTFTGLK